MSEAKIDKCLYGIHRIEVIQTAMQKDQAHNTKEIERHIKRTDLLEKKLGKIYTVMLIGAGVAIASLGPEIATLLKAII